MKEEIIQKLEEVFNVIIKGLQSVPADEINVVPFEGSWTPGQLIMHVILSASGFKKIITGFEKEAGRAFDKNVEQIKNSFQSSAIMKSPDAIEPEMKDYDKVQLLKKLNDLKSTLIQAVQKSDLSKLATGFELPYFGYLTKYEAAWFVIYHTQRHVKQLQNIMKYLQVKGEGSER